MFQTTTFFIIFIIPKSCPKKLPKKLFCDNRVISGVMITPHSLDKTKLPLQFNNNPYIFWPEYELLPDFIPIRCFYIDNIIRKMKSVRILF